MEFDNKYDPIQEEDSNAPMVVSMNEALELAGCFNKYQVKAIFYGFLQILFCGFILKIHQVLFISPKFECKDLVGLWFKCTEQEFCQQNLEFRITTHSHFVKQDFNLYCDQEYWVSLSQYALILGSISGSLYYGWFLETKGRKKAMLHSISVYIFFSILSIFSPRIIFFIICYFIMTFSITGYLISILIFIAEISDENIRVIGPMFIMFGFGLSRLLYSLLGYFVGDWKVILGLLSPIPLLLTTFLSKNLTESPRFLVSKKNFMDAKHSIDEITKVNGKKPRNFLFKEETELKSVISHVAKITGESLSSIGMKQPNHTYLHIFKYKSIRIRTLMIVILWFSFHLDNSTINSIFYSYTKNPFFNVAIIGCFSSITALISMGALLNYERKKVLRVFLIWIILSTLIFPLLISKFNWQSYLVFRSLSVLLMVIAKFCIQMGCHVLLIYTMELYPTSVRHLSLSFFFAGSYAGNLISLNDEFNKIIMIYVVSIIFMICYPYLKKLRETFLTDLKDTLKEEGNALLENQYSFGVSK